MAKPVRGWKVVMAKQTKMLMMMTILATSQAMPMTRSSSITRAGAEIPAFDCHQPTQMRTEPAGEQCGRVSPPGMPGQATLVQQVAV